MQNYIPSKTIT